MATPTKVPVFDGEIVPYMLGVPATKDIYGYEVFIDYLYTQIPSEYTGAFLCLVADHLGVDDLDMISAMYTAFDDFREAKELVLERFIESNK